MTNTLINRNVGKAITVKSLGKKLVELELAEKRIGVPISEELRQLYIDNNPQDDGNLTDDMCLNMICKTALLS
ncbi:hypothetical protein [Bacillus cereus group sp. BfR-BA-01518]|uniref:hypothetical protein n=1 Tax=Bacillus cereus group sp. BfR-BA-01518 TaxID=2920368 RepID=UPI001F56953C|nr:hypothetical protein [Bacillus cereus group sp. BfR-BA-01518]